MDIRFSGLVPLMRQEDVTIQLGDLVSLLIFMIVCVAQSFVLIFNFYVLYCCFSFCVVSLTQITLWTLHLFCKEKIQKGPLITYQRRRRGQESRGTLHEWTRTLGDKLQNWTGIWDILVEGSQAFQNWHKAFPQIS